jgi:hypothetical protein
VNIWEDWCCLRSSSFRSNGCLLAPRTIETRSPRGGTNGPSHQSKAPMLAELSWVGCRAGILGSPCWFSLRLLISGCPRRGWRGCVKHSAWPTRTMRRTFNASRVVLRGSLWQPKNGPQERTATAFPLVSRKLGKSWPTATVIRWLPDLLPSLLAQMKARPRKSD